MDYFVDSLSNKFYEEIQINIMKEAYNVVMESLTKTMSTKNFEKDKECTLKRLHKTIEVMHNLMLEQHKDWITKDVLQKIKFKLPDSKSAIGQIFSQTKSNTKIKTVKDPVTQPVKMEKIEFSREIPNSIEIPQNLFKEKPLNLKYNYIEYHFFTVNIGEEGKEISYYLTYAEKNKYSKRELIAVYKGKEQLKITDLPQTIKTKYNFE
ncbi:hypothetical protein H8356DRAFT_1618969 [Neocallimastix lanati (nom. inval.)]|jgi:hypothetical protein|uniref:Uncharacterized protein n=1 Tax=Neocallimastix californiae TaxID=1754190 RepID=A0A1Y2D6R9_9FUNG|nr:hypothetical protein H8356DRAFT_1618969 [Neocallimastix sp. JGI-2020a]ORY54897.1 hypothetical protein LY90DRAFT_702151 [Neocallimastix californiae]|eukprot:ORY54897.1 hypothetical protein LY90DRAFT_702151 [Neocallimastix californiae]